jgi:general secretion pathway protein G
MSLVEVMVVIAIILTLMSVIGVGVMGVWGHAQVDMTKLTMSKVDGKIQIHSMRKQGVPKASEGLPSVYGGEDVPQDAWGRDFTYVVPGPNGRAFDLISLGADATEGGSGDDADIKLSEF